MKLVKAERTDAIRIMEIINEAKASRIRKP